MWLKKLEDLDSPFVNETIKSVIEACIESVHECRKKAKELINNESKFHHINYAMLFFDRERYFDLLSRRSLPQEISFHFSHSHYMSHFHENAYYKDSDPYIHIWEGKLNDKIPQTQEEAKAVIQQIQQVFQISFIELAMELDTNQ